MGGVLVLMYVAMLASLSKSARILTTLSLPIRIFAPHFPHDAQILDIYFGHFAQMTEAIEME